MRVAVVDDLVAVAVADAVVAVVHDVEGGVVVVGGEGDVSKVDQRRQDQQGPNHRPQFET